jgi:hypothetical protein
VRGSELVRLFGWPLNCAAERAPVGHAVIRLSLLLGQIGSARLGAWSMRKRVGGPGATSSGAGVRMAAASDRVARPCVSAVTGGAARLWWMLSMVIG